MDKVEQVTEILTGFMQDIVRFVKMVWEFIEKFFGTTDAPEEPLTSEKLF